MVNFSRTSMTITILPGVTVKNIPTRKIIPPYIFTYENQSKTYRGYVFASGNT